MILPDFKAFPKTGRLLGVDWGAARTGIAVTDASRGFVFTRPALRATRAGASMARQIVDMAVAENVVGIVIGLPLRGDGTESETTAAVRAAATEMCTYSDLPICFIDETLTSFCAADEGGFRTVRDVKEKLDSESARIILENAVALINRI